MRRLLIASMMGLSAFALPVLIGCDDTVSHEKEVEVKDDGTKVTEEKKVTQDRETGDKTVTEEKKVDNPNR